MNKPGEGFVYCGYCVLRIMWINFILRDMSKCGIDLSTRDIVSIFSSSQRVVRVFKFFPKEIVKHPLLILAWSVIPKWLNKKHDLEEKVISHPAKSANLLCISMPKENQCGIHSTHELHAFEVAQQHIGLSLVPKECAISNLRSNRRIDSATHLVVMLLQFS